MNKLDTETRVRVIRALCEVVGINSVCRMTGVAMNTVLKLLADVGKACAAYHDSHVVNVKSRRIQCDEVWSFCHCKQKNVQEELKGQFGIGDVWTWTAVDADSKLIVSYMLGLRDGGYAREFMNDVAGRLANKVQLTTDGHKAYLDAVEDAFGGEVDYAQLIKIYGADKSAPGRYSPPDVVEVRSEQVCGTPDFNHVSTTFVERSNLTVRLTNRRFTRLTPGFSKKIENHMHAFALFAMHYNFCKLHKTIRVTPAMEAVLADHVWEIEELLARIA